MELLIISGITLILVVICVGQFIHNRKLKHKASEVIEFNAAVKEANEQEEKKLQQLQNACAEASTALAQLSSTSTQVRESLKLLTEQLLQKKEMINSLQEVYAETKINQEKMIEERSLAQEKELELKQQSLQEEFNKSIENLNQEYLQISAGLAQTSAEQVTAIQEQRAVLADLKAKQLAYIKEQQHKEEMLAQKDFFRPALTAENQTDILLLRDVQTKLRKKEAIDKIIWSVYYKPAYDVLCSHILDKKEKVCGIYKITSLDSGQSYIGQSVDIKSRISDHIKAGLDCGPSTNKLYQAMKKYQPCNFLFEVLEEVPREKLNEREKYYIDFYCTQEAGMNNTQGGA